MRGVAVCLHGYQRNTIDVGVIIRPADSNRAKMLLEGHGFVWDEQRCAFTNAHGLVVQFLIAGAKAGKETDVRIVLPQGDLNVEEIEGLSVVRLSRLIEMKIACGMSNLRRTHKDFADVVELIAIRGLDGAFARFLHKTVRPTFRQLVQNARVEEDRWRRFPGVALC